jgi:DNA repair protein RadC
VSAASDGGGNPGPNHRIQDLPEPDRPREKLERRGVDALTDAELLALFLRTGTRERSAVALAGDLLRKYRSLTGLARCTRRELVSNPGIGPAKASELAAAFALGRRVAGEEFTTVPVDAPEKVYRLLEPEMRSLAAESLRVVSLNNRHHLIAQREVFRGTINETTAHPREIFKALLEDSAAAFILAHSHPSGDPSPSEADRRFTRRMAELGTQIGIDLLDHVIIGLKLDGREPYFSFRESGLL